MADSAGRLRSPSALGKWIWAGLGIPSPSGVGPVPVSSPLVAVSHCRDRLWEASSPGDEFFRSGVVPPQNCQMACRHAIQAGTDPPA